MADSETTRPISPSTKARIAAEQWKELADQEDRMAAWNDEHVGCGAPQRAKAVMYRRTAEALTLEAETGTPHCTCCLKPRK